MRMGYQRWSLRSLCLACLLVSAPPALAKEPPVDFAKNVLPILTSAGCNSGACHGAAAGRGYLTLSLFGSRPEADYETLLHGVAGRYLDLQQPGSSLLLQKPSGFLEHGGGVRIDSDGADFQSLRNWVAQGGPLGSGAKLQKLSIVPGESLELSVGEPVEVQVTAQWNDGDRRPVAPWLVIEGAERRLPDTQSTNVQSTVTFVRGETSIELTPHAPGYWPVTIRLGPLARTLQLWVRERAADYEPRATTAQKTIDQLVANACRRVGQSLAGPCEPHLLARRLWIDLLGRHPSLGQWQEATELIAGGELGVVVDRLLASDEFNDRAARQIVSWIQSASRQKGPSEKLQSQVARFLAKNDNLRELALRMLTVSGSDSDANTEAAENLNLFHQFATEPRSRAELVASVWMGVRVGCAQCHDHPLDHWTQDDYFAMAACWAEVESAGQIRRIAGRTTTDLRTGRAAVARLPGQDAPYVNSQGLPADIAFAQWLGGKDNPLFSRNIANRVWHWLLGSGLVVELDDQRETNPPINPELLELLSARLQQENFSLRAIVRSIVLSDAYGRSVDTTSARLAHRMVAAREPKRIDFSMERLVQDALQLPADDQAASVPSDPTMMMSAADDDGCSRTATCADPLGQNLRLVAGEEINRLVSQAVATSWKAAVPPITLLGQFHHRLFGRPATAAQIQRWQQMSEQVDDRPGAQREFVEDLLWSWLVSPEFLQLH